MGDKNYQNKFSLRRENRIFAVQCVYMCEICKRKLSEKDFLDLCKLLDNNPENFKFAKEIVDLQFKNLKEIDSLIDRLIANWRLSRMSVVDLCILREATCELLYRDDIPPIVSINEAVSIARDYSNERSCNFINGILNSIKDTLDRDARTGAKK
jgi:N utilization substance protein B